MPGLFEHMTPSRAMELIEGYSGVFKKAIFLLDEEKKPLVEFPPGSHAGDLEARPLYLRENLQGYVAVEKRGSYQEELDFIAGNLSRFIESGFEVESLAGEVARNYEEISIIWRLSSRLGSGLDVDKVCRTLSDEVMNLVPSTNVSVLLVTEISMGDVSLGVCAVGEEKHVKRFFIPKVSTGRDSSAASAMVLNAEKGLMGYVHEKREPITVCDVTKDERFEGLPYPAGKVLIIPMIVEDSVIGAVLATDKLNGEEYFSTEIKLLASIAAECAVSIKKALLFDEIRDMLFKTAEAFSFAIDAKDPYTYGHSKRVTEIAVSVAKEMGVPQDRLPWVRLAALLHDTGKIGIPEEILNRSGVLDSAALLKMREHPVIGAKMIGRIHRFTEIATWICHHHEHYDGGGYPSGLKGGDIPLVSRIITVADTYDALTSDRPYRKAMKKDEALSVMKIDVGTHLDPEVFETFEKMSARF